MKVPIRLLLVTILAFTYVSATAQVSKSELLGALNQFDDLGLSAGEEEALSNANSKAVDKLFEIEDAEFGSDVKAEMFRNAKKENSKMFSDILDDKALKEYKKKVKKELKPFKRKAKFIKFLL